MPSTQRIMRIFSLKKNFFCATHKLSAYNHKQTLILTYAKRKLTSRPIRDPMPRFASMPIWRGIYYNGQQRYAHFPHESASSSRWHAVSQTLTCTPFPYLFSITGGWSSGRDYVPLVNLIGVSFKSAMIWWIYKVRGKRLQITPLVVAISISITHRPVHLKKRFRRRPFRG